MSMNVSSKVGYPAPWPQATPTPAPAPATANAAPPAPAVQPAATPAPPAPVDTFESAPGGVVASASPTPAAPQTYAADPTGADNIFAKEQLEKGNWATDTVPLRQANDVDCGAAVATMLAGAKNPLDAQAQSQLMDNLQTKYGTDKGTTPDQMKNMLANVGVEVRRGDAKLDPLALAGTLSQGGKTAAMVDSNKIRPDGDPNSPGAAHWVVVDGMNDKNEYRVRDPSDGSSYYVSQDKLASAMEGARSDNNGGGMLFVESANSNATPEQLLAASGNQGEALGDGSGTGSSKNKFLETTNY